MVEDPKYHQQELNEEDKEILDKVVLNYAVKFYTLTKLYPSPKKYAEEVVLKLVKKDSNIAGVFTLAYAKNSPDGQLIRPGELNQKLANDIRTTFQEQYIGLASQLQSSEFVKKFLNPRDLREGVLKKLEDLGVFIHLTAKEEILRQQDGRSHSHGRPPTTKIYNERGGKLSVYILADDVERLKRAMEKPDGIEYLYRKVIKSGLAEKLFKFQLLAFLYAADCQSRVDTANLFQRLQKMDDDKLEQLIDSQMNSIVEDRGYYAM